MADELIDIPQPSEGLDINPYMPEPEINPGDKVLPVVYGRRAASPIAQSIDNLSQKPRGLSESAYLTFGLSISEGVGIHEDIRNKARSDKEFFANDALNYFEKQLQRPETLPQKIIGWLPDIVIQGVGNLMSAPETFFLGSIAGSVVKKGIGIGAAGGARAFSKAAAVADKTLDEILNARLPSFVGEKKIGTLAGQALTIQAEATAGMIPIEAAHNYNRKTNEFDISGTITDAAEVGAMGLGVVATPFLAGTIFGKLKNRTREYPKEAPTPGEKNSEFLKVFTREYESGKVEPEIYNWYRSYLENPHSEQTTKSANALLERAGHKVNHMTNQVHIELASKSDIRSMNNALGDQLFSTVPESIKRNMSDLITHNGLDRLMANSDRMNGIKGVIHYFDQRIKNFDNHYAELNKMVDKHYTGHFRKMHTLGQEGILKDLIKRGEPAKRNYHIPNNVARRARQELEIKSLQKQIKELQRLKKKLTPEYIEKIGLHKKRIQEIKSKLEPILSHKKEIKNIENKLIKNGKVSKSLESKSDYQRLKDLHKYSIPARGLMHKVSLLHEKNKQEAFKGVLDSITKIYDANLDRLANPKNAIDYLKTRIESDVLEGATPEEVKAINAESSKEDRAVPADAESMIEQQKEILQNVKAEKLGEHSQEAVDRFEQFKRDESKLKDYLDCVAKFGETHG